MKADAWLALDESCAFALDHTVVKLMDFEEIKRYIDAWGISKLLLDTGCLASLAFNNISIRYDILINFV